MGRSIWWIRRDLRLTDNQALQAALEDGDELVPVYILDQNLVQSSYVGKKRLQFLYSGLEQLNKDLQDRGSRLIIRSGLPVVELSRLVSESGVSVIFAEADHSPYARSRDQRVASRLPLELVGSTAVNPPGSILKPDSTPYTVYTPFSKAWKSLPTIGLSSILPPPEQIRTPEEISSEPVPSSTGEANNTLYIAGEQEAQSRLRNFLTGAADAPVYRYDTARNMLDTDGTSRLSPYLRFGMLSPRQAAISAQEAISSAPDGKLRKGAETWLNELIWRDFYIHILYHYPHVREKNFRLEGIRWDNDPELFAAWCEGCTGYPIVDAAMRGLLQTGWMHNRARMVVASFLTKDLLIDWRLGERWFMQHLIDGDPAANNGGWQWTAGTGTDAAPYFRIFNPITQSKKFDPQGKYIRRWVPQLAGVPDKYIHQPWMMPQEIQSKVACRIGIDYPEPVIDHGWARERALDVYSQAKS